MNPLNSRRVLVSVNGALILGLLATGVSWFATTRSEAADSTKSSGWAPPTFPQFQREAKSARSVPIWPVDEVMIKQILGPDDLQRPIEKGEPSVWPYVGPIPPPQAKRESPPK